MVLYEEIRYRTAGMEEKTKSLEVSRRKSLSPCLHTGTAHYNIRLRGMTLTFQLALSGTSEFTIFEK